MKSVEFINEGLTNPYPLDVQNNVEFGVNKMRKSKQGLLGKFTTEDGNEYQIEAFKIGSTKAERIRRAEHSDNTMPPISSRIGGIWEVHFHMKVDGEFTSNQTNTGDAFRVFATVFDFIGYIVRNTSPEIISIKSKSIDTSRIKLYDTMLRRYAPKLGYKIHKTVANSNITRIELRKI